MCVCVGGGGGGGGGEDLLYGCYVELYLCERAMT